MGRPDEPIFEVVASRHHSFIRRALAQLGVRASDLDDAGQEVLLAIQHGLSTFQPSGPLAPEAALRGWIYGICERQAASYRRAEARRARVVCSATEVTEHTPGTDSTPEERLLKGEDARFLGLALATLEPSRRSVVVAYELEGVSMRALAAQLGIPLNSAWNSLRLGRQDLRAAWRRLAPRR